MGNADRQVRHTIKRILMKARRQFYGLRGFVPGLRERHRLEAMVGPLGFWDELQQYQLRLLRTNGLQPDHVLIDLGCGPLQGGVGFIKFLAPSRYIGVDKDPVRLKAAYSQIVRHNLAAKNPTLILSSTFGDRELNGNTFDFVWASQILYYFDKQLMSNLLAFIAKRLNPQGRFLGDIIGPEHYEFRFPECGWVKHTVETIQRAADVHKLQVRSLGRIADFGYPKRLSLHSNILIEITRK